jgi:ABC-type uncharacterized transport system involved in gliding motility auxiliary subunit
MSKLLFFLGLTLIVAGIVVGLITGNWLLPTVGLLAVGTILIVIWFILISKNKKSFWTRRSTQAGTNALIATAAMLAIIGLINFVAVGNSLRFDLTETQLFTLSPQSQEIVQNLSQPLKVWVFDRSINPETQTLLENYRRYGNNFQFELVDPEIKVGLAEKFKVQSLGEVYLEYGDKKQRIETIDAAIGSSLSEVQLTNAIEKIQRDRTPYIYFLQGHGEPQLDANEGGLSQAVNSLEARGYQVQPLNLALSNQIPENAEVIVVAGPTRQLFPAEVQALKDYLDRGGRLLLLLAPKTDPGLTPLLQDWGVKLDDRLAIDASGAGNILGFGPAAPIINNYGNHPITSNFNNGISVFPESRPLEISELEGIDAIPLVVTNENTWGESNPAAEEIVFDPQVDIKGPLNLALALTRTQSSDKQQEKNTQSRLVIFGSSTFALNGWFQQQLNSDLILNSVNWLAGEDEQILSISPREQTNRRINLTPLQAGIISWMALLIMPLIGLIVAVITWWRRR